MSQKKPPQANRDIANAETVLPESIAATKTIPGPAADSTVEETTGEHQLFEVDQSLYEKGKELGRGGMGIVSQARDRRVGREVAVKELIAETPRHRRRFEREALITGQLQHPSIVPVYEVGCWSDGRPFYSMKLVGGRPLDEIIDEARDDDTRLALIPRILPAVEAVAYAHEQGVIHRDLKPANMLIGEFGETVVIDWGLARGIDEPETAYDDDAESPEVDRQSVSAASSDDKLTKAGSVIGTPDYMSPEQARGERLDARADVYSLGALIYHALCGQPPFDGPSQQSIIVALLTESPPSLSQRAPNTPADLVSIVEKAMAPNSSDRYPDAAGLARDLKAFSTGRLVGAYRYTSWDLVKRFIRRNRALSSAIALLVLVAIVGGGTILRANRISEFERTRAVAAERRAVEQERAAQTRLAQVHWQAAVRRLNRGDHLAAEVLAAGALFEHPNNPAGPNYRARGQEVAARDEESRRLAGPAATWIAARALRFASRERELLGHRDWIYGVQPSADGRFVVTTAADHRAIIWDAASGQIHQTLEGHTGSVFQTALNANGDQLATSSYDGTVRLWSFPDGALHKVIDHPDDRVYGVCFAADGTLIAAGANGALSVFDSSSGTLLARIEATGSIPWRLYCPADVNLALLGTSGPEVVLVDLEAQAVTHRLPQPGTSVLSALLSADGKQIITANKLGSVRRYDRSTGELLSRAEIGSACHAMISSPDGRWLALGTEEITILDSATLRVRARLTGHSTPVVALAVDGVSGRLYSGGLDNRVITWRIPDASDSLSLIGPTASSVDEVIVSPDGRYLAGAGDDQTVRLWDLETGHLARTFEGHAAPVRGLAFVDDTLLYSSGMDRTLRAHHLDVGKNGRVEKLPHFGDEISRAPDGKTIVIGSGDGSVVFQDTTSGERQVLADVHEGRAWWVGFDPSGERLASASYAGTIAIIDPVARVVIRKWHAHDARIYDAAFHPDGNQLTTVDLSGWVRTWNIETGARLREWRVIAGEEIISLAWSPDAAFVLLTTSEGMRLYHPNGKLEARLDLGARTTGAAWTHDGRMIFSSQGRIFVLPLDTDSWRTDPEALLREAERSAGTTLNALIGMEE